MRIPVSKEAEAFLRMTLRLFSPSYMYKCTSKTQESEKRGPTLCCPPTPFYQASKLKVFLLISSLLQYEVRKANICICQNELTNHTASCIVIKTMILIIKVKILLYYMKLTVSLWKGIKRLQIAGKLFSQTRFEFLFYQFFDQGYYSNHHWLKQI